MKFKFVSKLRTAVHRLTMVPCVSKFIKDDKKLAELFEKFVSGEAVAAAGEATQLTAISSTFLSNSGIFQRIFRKIFNLCGRRRRGGGPPGDGARDGG